MEYFPSRTLIHPGWVLPSSCTSSQWDNLNALSYRVEILHSESAQNIHWSHRSFTHAAFLVDMMVLSWNMAIKSFPELKLCIFIAILRHASFPVQKALVKLSLDRYETQLSYHICVFLLICFKIRKTIANT